METQAKIYQEQKLNTSGCVMQGGSFHPLRRTPDSIPAFDFYVGMFGGELVRWTR